ncbi:CLUMA_CG011406, isoform A [Clunio marinus]|uniref:CLUMA_CG011406, isoform A n=1 Tax=Clunio marinus TaxID=568069 RepID=A0A1J1ICM7_9DIPT|nr:CLUMA_CG011406, isoform A [Clunio marinus]
MGTEHSNNFTRAIVIEFKGGERRRLEVCGKNKNYVDKRFKLILPLVRITLNLITDVKVFVTQLFKVDVEDRLHFNEILKLIHQHKEGKEYQEQQRFY